MSWLMKKLWCFGIIIVLGAVGSSAQQEQDGEWSEFRGPGRQGVSPITGLLESWGESGPTVLWRREIGTGFSGISVRGDRAFTMFGAESDEFLAAYQVADGKELWRLRVGTLFKQEFGDGPRSTPTVTADTVYAIGSMGDLVATDLDGAEQWRVSLTERFPFVIPQWGMDGQPIEGLTFPLWGFAASPLVYGDLVVVPTGAGGGQSLVALDRTTGKTRWTALDEPGGYASPLVAKLADREQLVLPAGMDIISVDPRSGDVLWRRPFMIDLAQPILLPEDHLFVSTANDVGAVVFRVVDGAEAPAVEDVWSTRKMKNQWSSSVYVDGYVFGFDNATLRCLAADTGELRWIKRGFGKGSLVTADGLLFILSEDGLLALAEASGEGYVERGRIQLLEGRTWTAPSIAHGRLFVRNWTEMVAVDLVKSEPPGDAS